MMKTGILTLAAVIVVAATASPSRANFVLVVTEVGTLNSVSFTQAPSGGLNTVTPAGTGSFDFTTPPATYGATGTGFFAIAITVGNYKLNISATTNTPGLTGAHISHIEVAISNAGGGVNDFQIQQYDNSFPDPYGSPVLVVNSLSNTFIGSGTISSRGYIADAATPAAINLLNATSLVSENSSVDADSSSALLTVPGSPFSLGNITTVHGLTPGTEDHFTIDTQTIPNPVPAGALLVLAGIPLAGFGAWVRKRTLKLWTTSNN
ncbi:MAG TPA: hypothetical protein VE988_07205 [Gemmataceae bacterium]|nr:hypothetical protein [Gemmataceae bacterium]